MVVLAVFGLVVLVRWQPLLAGGPSLVFLGVVAAALSPPRRGRPGARRAFVRSDVPYSTVRRWDAARESLAHLPDATIPPVGRPVRPDYRDPHYGDPDYDDSGYDDSDSDYGEPGGSDGGGRPGDRNRLGSARHPWAEPGDRELVRVLDPRDAAKGDPEETMAIDMRPLLAENALLEQTMSLDMRGFLHDPGYGRG